MSLFILDLDGVVYRGNKLVKGAKETIERLRERGERVVFLTNNSTYTLEDLVNKLTSLHLSCRKSDFYTSSEFVAKFLQRKFSPCRVMVIGERGLKSALRRSGFEVVSRDWQVEVVVVGMDRNFNYEKLACAQKAILGGAYFVAANADRTLPLEEGLCPGAGSILSALEAATGRRAIVVGKPNPWILEEILSHEGFSKRETFLIGDRLDTDIRLGKRAGVKTILVLTGVTRREEIGEEKPDIVIQRLEEIFSLL